MQEARSKTWSCFNCRSRFEVEDEDALEHCPVCISHHISWGDTPPTECPPSRLPLRTRGTPNPPRQEPAEPAPLAEGANPASGGY